jgi:hypothetical protein
LAVTSSIAADLRPIARLRELPGVGNRLMVELTVFTIAAYRAMLRFKVDRKIASEIVADIGWDVYLKLLSWSSMPFRLVYRDPGKRLQRTIRLLLRFPFNAPGAPGYAVEFWQVGDNLFTHFTHCPPQSFDSRCYRGTGGSRRPRCLLSELVPLRFPWRRRHRR